MGAKKYYWIKLNTDFFNQETIDFLLSQKNGCEYIVLYQMLCLFTANNNGNLATNVGEIIIPYNIEKIVRDTKYFDIDTVTVAMELYKKLGLIYEQENKILKIKGFDVMVGNETKWAEKKRAYKENKLPPVEIIKRLNREMIALPNGTTKFIDEKRYGGNGALTYDLAECKCEFCGNVNTEDLVIHHNNGYSNDIEDLYLLCKGCHGKAENGHIKIKHTRNRGGNCPPESPHKSIEIRDKRLDIRDIDIDNRKNKYGKFQRIKLTEKEYESLVKEYGQNKTDIQIELLDEYVESNNNKNKYTNFNLVLRKSIRENWFNNNKKERFTFSEVAKEMEETDGK